MKSVSMKALLEWAYRDQRVRRITGLSAGRMAPASGGLDSVLRAQRSASLGVAVQGGGGFGGGLDVHGDAETVHATVYGLPPAVRELVMRQAEVGGVPEWDLVLRWEPKWGWDTDAQGRKRPMEYNRAIEGWRGRNPMWCDVVQVGTAEEVAVLRQVYGAWWQALDVLAGHFRSHPSLLSAHRVVAVGVVASPWLAEKGA